MIDALFTPGQLILARLNEYEFSHPFRVLSSKAYFDAEDSGALCPALVVRPGRGQPQSGSNDGEWLLESQTWMVTICLSWLPDDDMEPDEIAGRTAVELKRVLQLPIEGLAGNLVYTGWDAPVYDQGYAEYTIHFTLFAEIQGEAPSIF